MRCGRFTAMYLVEAKILQALRKEKFPPLEMSLEEVEIPLKKYSKNGTELRGRADALLSFKWENSSYYFVAELRGQSNPKTIESAIQQARFYSQQNLQTKIKSKELFPMIVVPYLGDESIARLVEERVSGIDLSGNGVVIVPGELFVLRSGAKNKFRDSEPIKNFYSGTSSIVARVFLLRAEFGSVTEISDEIIERGGSVSMGTISKVLKRLQDNLIIGRQEKIKLLQGEKLLEGLQSGYRSPRTLRQFRGKVSYPTELAKRGTALAKDISFSFACRSPLPYIILPNSNDFFSVYVSSADEFLRSSDFEETNRFPNIEIIETKDPLAYFDSREFDSISYISPLQAYLELSTGGKREKESAEILREELTGIKKK